MARQTLLERIIEERVGQTTVGTVSIAVDRIAEEIAREALNDEEFRRAIREMVRRTAEELWKRLRHDGAVNGTRARPVKRKRTRRAATATKR